MNKAVVIVDHTISIDSLQALAFAPIQHGDGGAAMGLQWMDRCASA